MLLPPKIAAGVAEGTVTLAFRRWERPRVKVGGRFLTSAGLIEVTSVEQVADESITPADAEAAGTDSPAAVLKLTKGGPEVPLFRVGPTWAGPDPLPRRRIASPSGTSRTPSSSMPHCAPG